LFMTESLTGASWALWIGMQLDIEKMLSGCIRTDASSSGTISGQSEPPLTEGGARKTRADITVSPDRASDPAVKSSGLPTPPGSFDNNVTSGKHVTENSTSTQSSDRTQKRVVTAIESTMDPSPSFAFSDSKRIVSYTTLQNFYALLDRIERTSYVGALFLEAYAEKLRDDMCKDCWFQHNFNLDKF
jgi:hypothetical protein